MRTSPRSTGVIATSRTGERGSRWRHLRTDGSGVADVVGEVIEAEAPHRLVITFGSPDESRQQPSVVRFDIKPYQDIVQLTVTHEGLADQDEYEAASAGWAAVLSNLKSLLETGHVLPQAPWEMHADLRAEHTTH